MQTKIIIQAKRTTQSLNEIRQVIDSDSSKINSDFIDAFVKFCYNAGQFSVLAWNLEYLNTNSIFYVSPYAKKRIVEEYWRSKDNLLTLLDRMHEAIYSTSSVPSNLCSAYWHLHDAAHDMIKAVAYHLPCVTVKSVDHDGFEVKK